MRLVPTLALLLVACSPLPGKLCGAPGQPCCASSTCDDGAQCGTAGLCDACGGLGQACCGDAGCTGELRCTNAVCAAPLSCPCPLGATRCQDNGIERCAPAQGSPCPDWTTVLNACPAGSLCTQAGDSADCVEACPGACKPGVLVCTTHGLRQCVAAGACPSLTTTPDDPVSPRCSTGAVVDATLAWESPTPFGADVADIAGDVPAQYWILDGFGNIVRYASGTWRYEVRTTEGRRMRGLASCGLQTSLYAVGEHGVVLRRDSTGWHEESVGTSTALVDVACAADRAFALGADGRFYVREAGGWAGYATGATGALTAMALLLSEDVVYLAGATDLPGDAGQAGLVIRCAVPTMATGGPPTCVSEPSRATEALVSLWADEVSRVAWAVGARGTMVLRNAQEWVSVPQPEVRDDFCYVTGLHDRTQGLTTVVALTRSGTTVFREAQLGRQSLRRVPGGGLTRAWMLTADNVVFAGTKGRSWRWGGQSSPDTFIPITGTAPTVADLRAVAALDPGRLVAVGASGTRLVRQNDAWVPDEYGAGTTKTLEALTVRSAGEAYAVGREGTVLARRWGSWVQEAAGLTGEDLTAVAHDDRHVWAVGRTQLLEKDLTRDAWRVVVLPEGTNATGLAVRKNEHGQAQEVVIVGAACALWRYAPEDGTFAPAGRCGAQAPSFTSAAFLPSGELALTSQEGLIYVRTDAGLQAQGTTGGAQAPLRALVADGANVWAVGEAGLLLRVGETWVQQHRDLVRQPLSAGTGHGTGTYFVGEGGVILRLRPP